MEKKLQKEFIYTGFGFPVHLKNVTLFKVGNLWAPRIDLEKVAKRVVRDLAKKKSAFIGNEIFFIRSFLKLSKVDFGKRLGVTHAAVATWEKKREDVAPIQKGNVSAIIELITNQPRKPKAPSKKLLKNTATRIYPSPALAKIIGSKPVADVDVVKKIWVYIKKNNLTDKAGRHPSKPKRRATRKSSNIRVHRHH